MKFVADEMLGRLAKWLRVCGYDTAYFRHVRDSEILRLAVVEKRGLLTRDTLLIRRRGIKNFLFISCDQLFEQIKQVVRELKIPYPAEPFSRCIMCNDVLEPYTKEERHAEPFLNMYVRHRMYLASAPSATRYTGRGRIMQGWRESWESCLVEGVKPLDR